MTQIYEEFVSVLSRHRRFGAKIVLALSGGVDSRVMLHMLRRYTEHDEMDLIAVHVNHGLSSNASRWAEQCRQWCAADGIPCYVEMVDLGDWAGESLEHVARIARYQALSGYIAEGDLLLTGQHSDDQLETFLLALKRGSGPKGLSGMAEARPFGAGHIVRPLLHMTRRDIEQYAIEQGLSWIEDESNQDTHYDRNYIRHHITPLLEQRWPSIRKSVLRSAALCAQQESLLEELLSETFHQCLDDDGNIRIPVLCTCRERIREQVLRMWLAKRNVPMPSKKHLGMIWCEVAMASKDCNPKLKLSDVEVRRFSDRLFLIPVYQDVSAWSESLELDQPVILPDHLGSICLRSHSHHAHINCGALNAPLWIAFNPEGLSACPKDRQGRKKLKRLFQDYHVPSWLRRRTPILMCGSRVVSVANLFTDRDFCGDDGELVWDKLDDLGQT